MYPTTEFIDRQDVVSVVELFMTKNPISIVEMTSPDFSELDDDFVRDVAHGCNPLMGESDDVLHEAAPR